MEQRNSPSQQRAIPTPISVGGPSREHTMLLPSAIPILRSFAALQESSNMDQTELPVTSRLSGPQTTPPTPAVSIFRTPSRTRLTNASYRTPGKSSDTRGGYGTTRSVPPTPTPGGTFRSFRRERSIAPDVRRLSEVRTRQDARGDEDHEDVQRSNFLGDEEDEAADQRHNSSTIRRRNRPSLRHGTRSPSANSDASGTAEDENQTPFSLPRLFRTVSRQASSVFAQGGAGREYDDDVRPHKATPGHSRRQSSSWSPRGGLEASGEQTMEPIADGIRVWYSSYDTIDWLHDQIKDSRRVRRLRDGAKRSVRGKLVNAADRATGWVIVSIIGILTAIMAYLVVKCETFFSGLKYGYCSSFILSTREHCAPAAWVAWDQHSVGGSGSNWRAFAIYSAIALCLAWVSSLLTVYLTASTRFEDPETTSEAAQQIIKPSDRQNSETAPLLSKMPHHGAVSRGSPKPTMTPEPKRVMYFAAGSGIPEIKTILSGFVIKGYLGSVVLFVKSFGLALSVASGMSLGKEGPMVHIACCVGNIVSRQFAKYEMNEAKKREILSAACAAGVSVAFGAPIGGTLFSWEESSTYFPAKTMWRSFVCAAIAALTLRLLNPYGHGRLVLLEVNYTKDHHTNFIYLIAVCLGVVGGVYGAIWAKLNIAWSKRVRAGTSIKRYPILEVLLISVITSLASYSNPLTRIGGVEYVAELFAECNGRRTGFCSRVPAEMLQNGARIFHSVVVRTGLACITFGIRVPAGIFIPSLAAGAAFGRIFGLLLEYMSITFPSSQILPHGKVIVPGVYALIGAAATLAGVTRTTVSLVVIVVELTATLNYVVPVALTVLVAKTVADVLEHDGIYDLVINMNQFPFLDAKKEHHFDRSVALDIADKSLPYLRVDVQHTRASLQDQVDHLKASGLGDGCFPCLGSKGKGYDQQLYVVGILALNELQHVLAQLSDEPQAVCNLSPSRSRLQDAPFPSDSIGDDLADDPYDLVPYIDLAPLLVLENSPLELVQRLFTMLGARVVIVINASGQYRGTILKKTWLKYLKERER